LIKFSCSAKAVLQIQAILQLKLEAIYFYRKALFSSVFAERKIYGLIRGKARYKIEGTFINEQNQNST